MWLILEQCQFELWVHLHVDLFSINTHSYTIRSRLSLWMWTLKYKGMIVVIAWLSTAQRISAPAPSCSRVNCKWSSPVAWESWQPWREAVCPFLPPRLHGLPSPSQLQGWGPLCTSYLSWSPGSSQGPRGGHSGLWCLLRGPWLLPWCLAQHWQRKLFSAALSRMRVRTQGPDLLYLPDPDLLSEFHQEPQELAWSSWGIALIDGFMSTGLQSGGWEAGLLPNTQFLPSSAASSPGTRLGTISSRSQFPEPQSLPGCIPSF